MVKRDGKDDIDKAEYEQKIKYLEHVIKAYRTVFGIAFEQVNQNSIKIIFESFNNHYIELIRTSIGLKSKLTSFHNQPVL